MADVLTVLQSFGALTSGGVALISSQGRSIDSIIPGVTMEETSTDTLTTTDHPVETGVAVSDHSFRNPAELEMRVLWSDSTAQSVGYSIAVYAELQALQAKRLPFPIQTGKRSYQNMLFRTLVQKTDPTSEYALTVIATFRELITVKSASGAGTTSGSSTTPGVSQDPAAQTDPQSTAPTVDAGAGSSFQSIGPDSATLFGQMGGVSAAGVGTPATTANPYGDLSGVTGSTFSGAVGSTAQPDNTELTLSYGP